MYKKVFMLLIFAAIACPAHAYKVKSFQPLREPVVNQVYDYNNPNGTMTTSESYPRISQLEVAIFRRSYENENIYSRLTRLENRLFKRSFAGMPLASRVDNLLANVDQGMMYGISSNELSKLERKVLGQTFAYEDSDSRITRLEKEMLGAMQGGNLNQRFETVKTASKHYNSYPEISRSQAVYTPTNAYYGPQSSWSGTKMNGGVGGMLQNVVGSIFGNFTPGNMTGYTPPLYDPYNQYGAYNPGMGTQDYFMGNRGGYMNNRNIGNGTTVRILD